MHVVSQGCWFEIQIFEILTLKSIFGQIWAEKLKIVHFVWKLVHNGILEMQIPNLGLEFWNSDPKIHFWANLGPKIQSCLFCLKIDACCISRMLIRNPDFWNFDSKIHFWANLGRKTQNCPFCLKIGTQWYLGNADSKSGLRVLKFRLQNPFLGQIWVQKFKVARFVWKLVHVVSQGCWFEIQT